MKGSRLIVFAIALALGSGVETARGDVLGTAFTYQGQLMDEGVPANEEYDFIFRLFDDPVGGAQVGDDVEIEEWLVSDGLFTVELDFGTNVFTGDALWLEVSVRLNDGGGEYTDLAPRQPLKATPYALYALSGPGSGGYWTLNGDHIYNNNPGCVGIGTSNPSALLTLGDAAHKIQFERDGLETWSVYQTTTGYQGLGFYNEDDSDYCMFLSEAGCVGVGTAEPGFNLHVYEAGSDGFHPPARIGTQWKQFGYPTYDDWFTVEVGGDYSEPGWGAGTRLVRETGTTLSFQTEDQMNGAIRVTQMTLDADGKLGIGTTTPIALLETSSSTGVHGVRATTSAIPVAAFRTSTAGSWPAIHAESASSGSDATGIRSYLTSASPGTGSAAILGCVNGTTMSGYGVHGSHAGYGIGVYGDSVNGTGVYAKSTNGWALYAETENGATAARFVGNVEIVSPSTEQILIEFGEGLDYAEGFDVSDKSEIAPGTVLVIDADNAGELAISKAPYDRKVAGIVAGANGLGSAVRLGAGQYDFDVALAGRVFCNVDASYGAIQPGDLLTTSPTPGYAMKVTDHEQAQGAILGKAMQPLKQGEKGQILVLVTLQ